MTRFFIIGVILLLLLVGTPESAAQNGTEFVPLAPIGGVPTDTDDPSGFFNAMFRIGVGVAALLAVIMIIIGGFQYLTSEAPWAKSDGKSRITGAILGLLLILLSYVLLAVINPDILSFRIFN